MAQTFAPTFYRAVDADGNPLPGAKLYFYLTGTLTPSSAYTDAALGTPHASPVVADAGGLFAAIYLSSAIQYRCILKTSADVTVADHDNVAYSDESARDALATALTAGTGVTVTPNDGADTITIATTITQYTDEMARDALGTALVAGVGIGLTVNDAGDTITVAMTPSTSTAIGYATGAGGAVTQATNKATGVTLDKACGQITMNAAALAAGVIVSFVLTNTFVAAGAVLVLNHLSGGTPGSYTLNARSAAGSATIDVRNNTAGSLAEAIVIAFAVIKAVAA